MSTPDLLERFCALEISSADFPDQILKLLCSNEYQECVQNLKGEALAWLVEYLDNVRSCILSPYFHSTSL